MCSRGEVPTILRIDHLPIELPAPSHPSPNSASAVQELLGGKFGEMSTLMKYTFQSFNFRGKDRLKPFYDLISNAAEEYEHIELVSHTINRDISKSWTGAHPEDGTELHVVDGPPEGGPVRIYPEEPQLTAPIGPDGIDQRMLQDVANRIFEGRRVQVIGPQKAMPQKHTPEEERRIRDAALDHTIEDTFPASDPPSTLPDPDDEDALDDRPMPPKRREVPRGEKD